MRYDAIVVGARCAGATTAMLLARQGRRVLLVDRAAFPSDTISTHVVHPTGAAALARWGLLDELTATGCPPIDTYSFDFGPVTIAGSPGGIAYCPRRTILDELLVRAAVRAGAELRESFAVEEILVSGGVAYGVRGRSGGGAPVTEQAGLVIGADGRHSLVARAMGAEVYDERPARMAMYYAYWRDLPVSGFETTIRVEHKRGWAAAPTHDGLTVLGVGWPIEEFHANRGDIEASYLAALDFAPEFAERVRGARRESRFAGTAELGGWFRKPYGPGWALVGDAGYHKNPITAMGISDAFRDAELLAAALAAGDDLASYRHERDQAARAMYEMTDEFARLEPPPAEMQRLLGGIAGDQTGMDAFVSVQAGTLPPAALFAQPAAS